MLPRQNAVAWMDNHDQDDAVSWPSRPTTTDPPPPPLDAGDWFISTGNGNANFLNNPLPFYLPPSSSHPHPLSSFVTPFPTTTTTINNNPFEQPAFNFDGSGLPCSEPAPNFDSSGFGALMGPLELGGPVGPGQGQPTLYQKRVMGRAGKKRRRESEGDGDGESGGEEGLNYDDSDDWNEEGGTCSFSYDFDYGNSNGNSENNNNENGNCGGNFSNSNANSVVTGSGGAGGEQKGKRKGLPAKNLMAERRRRKKLNDRLYMLRSVVPKISKMDRASILGDAIDYLKELLQRISDLHNELESSNPGSMMSTTNSHPSMPLPLTLPCRVKEELCPNSLPLPKDQPARIEVRAREGRAVNIHMFCSRRPGLLLSTIRALDNLGLDIQQAVISCFNGFALDIFRAEQCSEGHEILPEQIKAVLLDSTGFHGVM